MKASASATGTEMPGQPGLSKTVHDPSDGSQPSFDDFSGEVVELSLATSFDVTDRYDIVLDEDADTSGNLDGDLASEVTTHTSNYLQVLDGWFKAPATATYIFYMSCDDSCKLEFDSTNYYESGATASLTEILTSSSYMSFRNYFSRSGN